MDCSVANSQPSSPPDKDATMKASQIPQETATRDGSQVTWFVSEPSSRLDKDVAMKSSQRSQETATRGSSQVATRGDGPAATRGGSGGGAGAGGSSSQQKVKEAVAIAAGKKGMGQADEDERRKHAAKSNMLCYLYWLLVMLILGLISFTVWLSIQLARRHSLAMMAESKLLFYCYIYYQSEMGSKSTFSRPRPRTLNK